MSDNLKLSMGIIDVKGLMATMEIRTSEYCILYTSDPSDTIIITTNDGFKLLLLDNYKAIEISDWNFNENYKKESMTKDYTFIGNDSLVYKGY